MSRNQDKVKAIHLRKKGMSYSQIKEQLGISKSTLSGWLSDMPLSAERIRQLRDRNERRIERSRETKRAKKELRRKLVYQKVSQDISSSTDIDLVVGFYLYWGEGTKTSEYTISLTNSDPAMIRCFIAWVRKLGADPKKLKVKLHLYADQNEKDLKKFWSKVTQVPETNFYKSYRKTTRSDRKTYKGMFPYGTCVVIYSNRTMYEYVMEGIRYLKNTHS